MADHNDPNAVNSIFSDIDVSAADVYDMFGYPSHDTDGGEKVVIALTFAAVYRPQVMIAVTNRIEFVATYYGVLRARMVAVPINPRSATGEVVRILVDSGARQRKLDHQLFDHRRPRGLEKMLVDVEPDSLRDSRFSHGGQA